MIIGHHNLLKLYPNFKDDIQENGIDLRIGQVYKIHKDHKVVGSIDGIKHLPTYYKIRPTNKLYYKLLPKNYYFIEIDRDITIPSGYCQFYFLRSTFSRCGLVLTDAVGDDSFNGRLMLGVYNSSPQAVYAGLNERIIQAVTIRNDGTALNYDGDYQDNRIYKGVE